MSDKSDIADLRRELTLARQDLAESRARLEIVERLGGIGLWTADLTTGDGTWSPAMYELFARDPQLGPPSFFEFQSFIHPDDHESLSHSIGTMLEGGAGPAAPVVMRTHPDVSPSRILETLATMVEGTGNLRATGTIVDVTEREGARSRAANSTRRLAQVLDRIPFVVFGLDQECRITFSNQKVGDLDPVGLDFRMFSSPESRGALDAAIARARTTDNIELLRAKDVNGRWWETRYVGVPDDSGQVQEVLAISLDITEQRTLEVKLQEAQSVESLGVLAGGIAHDFNNLLVGIIGNADLAMLEVDPSTDAHDNLRSVLEASERAAELCAQMLAYSGRGHFVLAVIDPREVLREIANLLSAAMSKKCSLRFAFDEQTKPIHADVSQFRQVAMNLLTNASDALDGQPGVITVSSGTTTLPDPDSSTTREFTFIEVADDGVGMDDATQARMFEPFYSSKGMGRGLGLAAVRGIVQGHSGQLLVTSHVGQGTTVRVLFPVAQAHAVQPAVKVEPTRTLAPGVGTILVVDDESAVRTLAVRTLERAGYSVLTAANGAIGVDVFAAHHADVIGVLLDLNMPEMGGVEALEMMRAIDPSVRAVISSGYTKQEVAAEFHDRDHLGFLQKPYRPGELRDLFATLIQA